jgi:sterol desaturase/sphingolipid hydroxylase (fatty acid hydroxylase superfamily)
VPLSYIFALPLCVISIHWLLAGFFTIRDVARQRQKFAAIKRSASRKEPREIIHIGEWLSLAKTVLINQLLVLPSSMLASYYFLKITNDLEFVDFKFVPSFSMMFYKFVLCMMVYEISFFYIHFMLHHPLIFAQDQKQRRDYTTLDNLYQHPIEFVLLNIIPSALAVFLTRSDAVTSTIFIAAIVIAPVFEQSGLHLPHAENHACDDNSMMDYLHGTCRNFLQSEKNHKILLSVRSLGRSKTE